MPARPESEITRILGELRGQDDKSALERLLPIVYGELRRMAQRHMAEERADHTLQATALVHEAYMRLIGQAPLPSANRAHFFRAAAEAMRRILIEHVHDDFAERLNSLVESASHMRAINAGIKRASDEARDRTPPHPADDFHNRLSAEIDRVRTLRKRRAGAPGETDQPAPDKPLPDYSKLEHLSPTPPAGSDSISTTREACSARDLPAGGAPAQPHVAANRMKIERLDVSPRGDGSKLVGAEFLDSLGRE